MDGGRLDFGHVQNDVEEKNTVRKGGVDATIQGHAPLLGKPRHARTINLIIRLENQRNFVHYQLRKTYKNPATLAEYTKSLRAEHYYVYAGAYLYRIQTSLVYFE